MDKKPPDNLSPPQSPPFSAQQTRRLKEVSTKAARKLQAQKQAAPGLWFGLGMMGLIGWSVVVPTLLGAGIGMWLDNHYPGTHRWTLALLVAGLTLGCFNAWHWVAKEDRVMHEKQEDDHD